MAIPNALNPNVYELSFRHGTAVITGGTGITATEILDDVGGTARLGKGSIYISSKGTSTTTVIWVLLDTAWTPLTIN